MTILDPETHECTDFIDPRTRENQYPQNTNIAKYI